MSFLRQTIQTTRLFLLRLCMYQFIWPLARIVTTAIISIYMESVYLNIEHW